MKQQKEKQIFGQKRHFISRVGWLMPISISVILKCALSSIWAIKYLIFISTPLLFTVSASLEAFCAAVTHLAVTWSSFYLPQIKYSASHSKRRKPAGWSTLKHNVGCSSCQNAQGVSTSWVKKRKRCVFVSEWMSEYHSVKHCLTLLWWMFTISFPFSDPSVIFLCKEICD